MALPTINIIIEGPACEERLALCYLLHRELLHSQFPTQCNETSVPHNYIQKLVSYREALKADGVTLSITTREGNAGG